MDSMNYLYLSLILASLGATLALRRLRKRKIKRRYWVRPWLKRRDAPTKETLVNFYRELLQDGDVQEYRSTLRMSPDVFSSLMTLLKPALSKQHTNFRTPISAETRLSLTLRYLALGECFRSVSQTFRVGLSTSRLIVRETCKAIIELMQTRYLKTPRTEDECKNVAHDFKTRWNFPHVVGTVHGKHVRIIAPRKSGTFYHNYKDFFSIVLLGIANADYQFIYIDSGSEGKASDGGIWSKCTFYDYLNDARNPLNFPQPDRINGIQQPIPYFLLGDDAFKLGPNLLKPYPGSAVTKKQEIFNYRLSQTRRVIENTFGILTMRFKIYKKTMEVSPEFASDIVMATCILHNFLRQTATNDYIPALAVDQELEDGQTIPGAWRQEGNLHSIRRDSQKNASQFAKNMRNTLADYFLTPTGEVEWQYRNALM